MIAKKYLKHARYMYIYADGHAVLVCEERKGSAKFEYVTIHEKAFDVRRGKGRLIVGDKAAIAHILLSRWVGWKGATELGGSESTKKLGLRVATVYLDFGGGETWINSFPDILSSDFTVQEESAATFAEECKLVEEFKNWGYTPIAGLYRAPVQESVA